MQDAASKNIATQMMQDDEITAGKYDIALPDKDLALNTGEDDSLQATFNLGWCPEQGSDDWIHKGDYMNDEHTRVLLGDCVDKAKVCKGHTIKMKQYVVP